MSAGSASQDAHALEASSDAADSGFSDREVDGPVLPCEAGLKFRLDLEAEPPLMLELTSEGIPPSTPVPEEEGP